jgi:hypothetical protein
VARGEELARLEGERAGLADELARAREELAQARRRIAELEGVAARHEQRVVKAYQRLTSDARAREKARKAIAIALQLLEGAAPQAPDAQGRTGDTPSESTSTPK